MLPIPRGVTSLKKKKNTLFPLHTVYSHQQTKDEAGSFGAAMLHSALVPGPCSVPPVCGARGDPGSGSGVPEVRQPPTQVTGKFGCREVNSAVQHLAANGGRFISGKENKKTHRIGTTKQNCPRKAPSAPGMKLGDDRTGAAAERGLIAQWRGCSPTTGELLSLHT